MEVKTGTRVEKEYVTYVTETGIPVSGEGTHT